MRKYKKFIPVNTPLINKSDSKFVEKSINSGWISSEGPNVKLFEKKMAKYLNRNYGCAVSSGTAALEIAIKALNLKKNDEVIISNRGWISVLNALKILNLKPKFIDVKKNSPTL